MRTMVVMIRRLILRLSILLAVLSIPFGVGLALGFVATCKLMIKAMAEATENDYADLIALISRSRAKAEEEGRRKSQDRYHGTHKDTLCAVDPTVGHTSDTFAEPTAYVVGLDDALTRFFDPATDATTGKPYSPA